MKGMPHFRQYPMGDVVNANLEPGEYVLRRNAVNALGVDNMELLNHADGAHGALNKLMVSASLVNHQSQDNTSVKTEANGFPIADSPVRQRVDATRQMQDGGPISAKGIKGKAEMMMSEEGKPYYKSSQIMSVPASQVGSEGGPRYYLGEDTSRDMMIALEGAKNVARGKMRYSPADSIPQAMVEGYFDEPEAPKKKGRLRSLLGLQQGGPVRGYQDGDLVEEEFVPKELAPGVTTSETGGISFAGGDVGHKAIDAWKKDPAMFGEEHDFRPKSAIGKLQSYLFDKRMGKLTESDPQLKSWWEKPSGDEETVRMQSQVDDVQAALGEKSTEDYSRSLGRQTHLTEGSPYYGTSLVDLQEEDSIKGRAREAQYFETDKGRYRLSAERQGGLFDPVRNFFGAIPKRVDSGEDFSYQQGGPVYGYKNGGQVKGDVATGNWGGEQGSYMKALEATRDSTMSEQELKSMALVDHFRKMGTGERVESSDRYNGKPAYKSEEAYKRAFGMQTPLSAEERFTQARLGLNPEMFTAQQKGLLGKVLLQRLGNEVQ